MFIFADSLLGTTIQDRGKRERSNNQTILLDLLQKIKLFLLFSTFNSDWRIYLVEKKYICMPVRVINNKHNFLSQNELLTYL